MLSESQSWPSVKCRTPIKKEQPWSRVRSQSSQIRRTCWGSEGVAIFDCCECHRRLRPRVNQIMKVASEMMGPLAGSYEPPLIAKNSIPKDILRLALSGTEIYSHVYGFKCPPRNRSQASPSRMRAQNGLPLLPRLICPGFLAFRCTLRGRRSSRVGTRCPEPV